MFVSSRVNPYPQGLLAARENNFADETPAQQAAHREIAWRYHQPKRRWSPKMFVRIRELERVFRDRYGEQLPDNAAGRDYVFLIANHLAHRDDPERIAEWVRSWAPWLDQDDADDLIARTMRRPYKWTADKLAERLGIDYANRTRLKLRTIGATDCKKTKRMSLRRKKHAALAKARRAKAGAKPRELSTERLKPWNAQGVSRSTYYRRNRANDTGDTVSTAACPSDITSGNEIVSPNHQGAPPPTAALRRVRSPVPRDRAVSLAGPSGADRVFAVPRARVPRHRVQPTAAPATRQ
ncbi:hypothetical protein ABIE89_008224 [Bradyrhizobium niftali]|uniref:hypothetical protein n=1 Tax=Bradyrhizobium niftali TaxID=2560055 RepID=UPI00383970E0